MADFTTPIGFQDCWQPIQKPQTVKSAGAGYFEAGYRLSDYSGEGGSQNTSNSGGSGGGGAGGRIAPADRARLSRVVSRAPEVMVKVSRPAKSDKHGNTIAVSRATEGGRVADHLDYISRNGKIELETDDGLVLSGKSDTRNLYRDWIAQHDDELANGKATGRTRISTSIVLSMPKDINASALKDAARAFAEIEFGGWHNYVMALHTDTKHPHVHLTVRTVGFDGVKLNIRKPDLQRMRDQFAIQLRKRGIEAESTPRYARGVSRKSERIAVKKIRDRGGKPFVDMAKRKEMARDVAANGGNVPTYPWDEAIIKHRNKVMATYIKAAEYLSASKDPDDRTLGQKTATFVDGLFRVGTERADMGQVEVEKASSVDKGAAVAKKAHPVQDVEQSRQGRISDKDKGPDKGR